MVSKGFLAIIFLFAVKVFSGQEVWDSLMIHGTLKVEKTPLVSVGDSILVKANGRICTYPKDSLTRPPVSVDSARVAGSVKVADSAKVAGRLNGNAKADSIYTRTLKTSGNINAEGANGYFGNVYAAGCTLGGGGLNASGAVRVAYLQGQLIRSLDDATIDSNLTVGGKITGNLTGTADSAKVASRVNGGVVNATSGTFSEHCNISVNNADNPALYLANLNNSYSAGLYIKAGVNNYDGPANLFVNTNNEPIMVMWGNKKVAINKFIPDYSFDVSGAINCDTVFSGVGTFSGVVNVDSLRSTKGAVIGGNVGVGSNSSLTIRSVPTNITLDKSYADTASKGKCKLYLLRDSVTNNYYGLGVGSSSNLTYHSSGNHSFFIDDTAAITIGTTAPKTRNIGIGKTPTKKLDVSGTIYAQDTVSASVFIDRTPWYSGSAVTALKTVKGNNGKLDHKTLPKEAFVKDKIHKEKTVVNGRDTTTITDTLEVEGRDLSMTVSMLIKAIQEISEQLDSLKSKISVKE